ncbi:MAG: hypothetical protein JSV68_09705 [Anaerolineaceae bacterium]|nr:MAG: hypothetical protein JSV68_09705 [Anaerolineaceae bacterium]
MKAQHTRAPDENANHEAFLASGALVAAANDSTRKINRTARQAKIQKLLAAGDKFTHKLREAFAPGDRMTPEEIQERVLEVFKSDEVMELEAREVLRYPFGGKS